MQRPFVVLILRQVLFFLEKCFAQYLEILGCADFFTGGDERACHREARFHDVARVVFTLAAMCDVLFVHAFYKAIAAPVFFLAAGTGNLLVCYHVVAVADLYHSSAVWCSSSAVLVYGGTL